ncbi:hypothetical protein GC163_23450 [bacterium]|nr:hypothetical protein [bacterium]
MTGRKRGLFGSLLTPLLLICGCGRNAAPAGGTVEAPTMIEEIAVTGFDPDGEPVIKKWSDGKLWIHFEAMPPFFAEDQGTEQEFEDFEAKIQEALGVAVRRADREVFVIDQPEPDTAEKVKAWLEAYHKHAAAPPN